MKLTQLELKNLFTYHNDGYLINKVQRAYNAVAGQRAGKAHSDGSRRLDVNGRTYYEHRLIWLYHNGTMPESIDHINGMKNDNRIENLRACTAAENSSNQAIRSNNSSGYKGVYFEKKARKWVAQINISGVTKRLGYFQSALLAALAYDQAARDVYGEFCCVNFPMDGERSAKEVGALSLQSQSASRPRG